MDFAHYLETAASKVEHELEATLKIWGERVSEEYPALEPFVATFIDQCRGGKRIRGALVSLGYNLAGGENTEDILKISVAFEIFQTSILAHDDIIDRSELRRGKPSLYQALGGDHYGVSQAICLGDLGFFLAEKIITDSNFTAEKKLKALSMFASIKQQTVLGEILDVYEPTRAEVTKEGILDIIRLKTSPYTVIGPLSIGAALGDANQDLLNKIHTYGDNLGTAYQIHDDVLGVFAEEETLGKSNVSDIIEGKRTLLYWYAKTHGDAQQLAELAGIYGKPSLTKDAVSRVQSIFKETGAYDYATDLVKIYTEKALNIIPELTSDLEQQTLLRDIAKILSERKK